MEKNRTQGIGTALMDTAEMLAANYADTVYLGVGLHSGYGNAQRMYVKRGYIPDGSGVWYCNEVCRPYGECKNDDDLVLYLSKNCDETDGEMESMTENKIMEIWMRRLPSIKFNG